MLFGLVYRLIVWEILKPQIDTIPCVIELSLTSVAYNEGIASMMNSISSIYNTLCGFPIA